MTNVYKMILQYEFAQASFSFLNAEERMVRFHYLLAKLKVIYTVKILGFKVKSYLACDTVLGLYGALPPGNAPSP